MIEEEVTQSLEQENLDENKEITEFKNMPKTSIDIEKEKKQIKIEVVDYGKGIEDVPKAKEPFYTTRPELDRSGMGFSFMEAFMDDMEVESRAGFGTKVTLTKKIGQREEENRNGCGDSSY